MKILIFLVVLISIMMIVLMCVQNSCEQFEDDDTKFKVDFLTLFFDNEIEIELLKLQALSFFLVPTSLIHEIIVCWNDVGSYAEMDSLISFYPRSLRSKVRITNRDNIIPNDKKSDWRNQQLCKLLLAKTIKAPYYIILDGKNHFIKPVKKDHFFTPQEHKPKLFLGNPGKMIGCFDYCLNYFGISKSSLQLSSPYSVDDPDFQFCTTTPFILKTDIVLEMVSYMEFLEKMDFSQLFEHHKEGTEFYFYISYLILKQYISQYHLQKKIHVTLWPDLDKEWNQIESIEQVINQEDCPIFGLHRRALLKMEKDNFEKLLSFYKTHYPKEMINKLKYSIKIFKNYEMD
jgi:hypothetical protein